jgi:3-carboxy-cis,cis-muconate cycloisomerase
MTDLLWPGDDRAGEVCSDAAFLAAMVAVEDAWLEALVGSGIAPVAAAKEDLIGLVGPAHLEWLAAESEAGGNPAMALVSLLRDGLREHNPDAARWLHRGLTSQDVVDTALMVCARDAVARIRGELREQVRLLVGLVEAHRGTGMAGRTLTQHAVPTTFGLKAAQWLTAVLDAYDDVARLVLPVQVGGAAGTMAATDELARTLPDPAGTAAALAPELATRVGLAASTPWHTTRATITRLGDTAVRCTDAWGRVANDVLTLSRPEIGELSEGTGGGSSTMPHKANPVLSTLVRRAALAAPSLGATLHVAAADMADERAAGAWHVEWATLRTLLRRTVVAASQTSELLGGLRVHEDRMRATLESAREDLQAEQRTMAGLAGTEPAGEYLGATAAFVEAPLARAAGVLATPWSGDRTDLPRPEETE